ncbi:Uncharacterised protein [Cedecea neteri]|uniref:Uncharacterized protein n=1 Tax=Cedecea neteri TaxID=158822 RepID=A0A2X3JAG3_9ENTR|nr:Uncharacterised protein [Cedecea neteri]
MVIVLFDKHPCVKKECFSLLWLLMVSSGDSDVYHGPFLFNRDFYINTIIKSCSSLVENIGISESVAALMHVALMAGSC